MTVDSEKNRRLMEYALALLSRRAYPSAKLSHKLLIRGKKLKIDDLEVECRDIISRLKDLNLLDDADYMKRFVEERCRVKMKGMQALRYELKQRGIPQPLIDDFFQSHPLDESALAQTLLEKKARVLTRFPDPVRYKKGFSMLISRGFSLSIARKALDIFFHTP
ncbi:MAG: hypothetical protein ACD_28C00403G0005 [uncultured bacterium]|nr:MAG: hypothetical protein ACD_28C00403G0005 [uncultured bacterium]